MRGPPLCSAARGGIVWLVTVTRSLLGLSLLLVAACDGSTCAVGDMQACTCDDGRAGFQSCGDDGTFGPCRCAADMDAGAPTDGGGAEDAGARDAGAPDAGAPDAGAVDAGADVDGGGDGCDLVGFTPTMTSTAGSPDDLSHLMAATEEDLFLELLFGVGASDTPHTFTFTGENYADCHTCLVMDAECNGDRSVCGTHYLVQSGRVTFTSLSRTALEGTLEDVRMVEVTIEPPPSFRSTPVADGRTWCIPSLSFSGSL
jgi:hypothetical protein